MYFLALVTAERKKGGYNVRMDWVDSVNLHSAEIRK